MNIGIVTTWFERGAAYVSRAYRDVLSDNHNVFIYARGGEAYATGDPYWDKGYVTWGDRASHRGTSINFPDFRRWVEKNRLEMVIFNEQRDYLPVLFARRDLDVAIGAYVDYYTSETVECFDLYDFLLCNTRRHYSVFEHHPNALYVPWGTDCQLFSFPNQRNLNDGVVFFHSAGMSPSRKGTRVSLEAFRRIEGNCRFVLHIQDSLEKHPEIARLCKDDPRIEVLQKSVHAPGYFHRGDVYVYPTVLEGIGLTIPEAMACGLPVIAPDCPPMNEFVIPGVNGRLVAPREYRGRFDGYYWAECYCAVEDVARAMQYYMDNQHDLLQFKRQARKYAEAQLDWEKNSSCLAAKLESFKNLRKERIDLNSLEDRIRSSIRISTVKSVCRRILRDSGALKHLAALEYWIYD